MHKYLVLSKYSIIVYDSCAVCCLGQHWFIFSSHSRPTNCNYIRLCPECALEIIYISMDNTPKMWCLVDRCSQISPGVFTDDTDLYVVTIRRGSVIADFEVEVNKTVSPENILSTLVDAAKSGNLSLDISPDGITTSGMFTKITVRLKLCSNRLKLLFLLLTSYFRYCMLYVLSN